MNNNILCCIFNHDSNGKAIAWKRILGSRYETVILDSGSCPPCPDALNFENIYYSGLMNESYRLMEERGAEWLVIVTSDIEIDKVNSERLLDRIEEISKTRNVGLYQPCCKWKRGGRALPQSMCHFTGRLRKTNFQEGWFHMVKKSVLDKILPIDLSINRLGWGVDLALCHSARIQGLHILVDDKVKAFHPKGRGYHRDEAKDQMTRWLSTIDGYESPRHFRPNRSPIM